jgi:hypothetical protein
VVGGQATLVGQSASAQADESVDLVAPAAGTYLAVVSGYTDAPGTSSTPFQFRDYEVGTTGNTGTFTVSPANSSTTGGQTLTVTAAVGGVSADTAYLGWAQYIDGSGTLVQVNPTK